MLHFLQNGGCQVRYWYLHLLLRECNKMSCTLCCNFSVVGFQDMYSNDVSSLNPKKWPCIFLELFFWVIKGASQLWFPSLAKCQLWFPSLAKCLWMTKKQKIQSESEITSISNRQCRWSATMKNQDCLLPIIWFFVCRFCSLGLLDFCMATSMTSSRIKSCNIKDEWPLWMKHIMQYKRTKRTISFFWYVMIL